MNRVQLSEESNRKDLISWAQSRNIVPSHNGQDEEGEWNPAVVSLEEILSKLDSARELISRNAAAIGDEGDEDAPRIASVLASINAFTDGTRDPAVLSNLNRFEPERLLEIDFSLPELSGVIDRIATLTGEKAKDIRYVLEYRGNTHNHAHLLNWADTLEGPYTLSFKPVLQNSSFWTRIPAASSLEGARPILHGRMARNNDRKGQLTVTQPFALTREYESGNAFSETQRWLWEAGLTMYGSYSGEEMVEVLSTTFGVTAEVMKIVFPGLVKKQALGPARKFRFSEHNYLSANEYRSLWVMGQVQGRDASLEITADGLQLLTL